MKYVNLCLLMISWQNMFGQIDTILPTPVCHSGIIGNFLNIGDTVNLDASFFDNGSFDDKNPNGVLTFFYGDNHSSTKTFNLNKPNEVFEIQLEVADETGNISSCQTFISFQQSGIHKVSCDDDSVPPITYLNAFTNLTFNSSGRLFLTAEYFVKLLTDNKSISDSLKITFGPDPLSTIKIFNCSNIPVGTTFNQPLYIWDEAGNYSSLNVPMRIIDPGNSCLDNLPDTIAPISQCLEELTYEILSCLSTTEIFPLNLYNSVVFPDKYFPVSFENKEFFQFGCAEIGKHSLTILIDNASGIISPCESIINVTDPEGYCLLGSNPEKGKEIYKVYPNPLSDALTISGDHYIQNVLIVDMLGNELIKCHDSGYQTVIDTSSLNVGTYILFLKSSEGIQIVRLAKID